MSTGLKTAARSVPTRSSKLFGANAFNAAGSSSKPEFSMQEKFKRDLKSLSRVFCFIDSFFSKHHLDSSKKQEVLLAVEELFTNVLKYQAKSAKGITIGLRKGNGEVTIRMIIPDTEAFDFTKAKDPDVDLPIELRRPGGLGIYLTKRMVDRIEFSYRNRTTTITLTKTIGASDA